MSYIKNLTDSEYDTLLKSIRKKRGLFLFVCAVAQFLLLMTVGIVQISLNGINPYVGLPLCLFSSLLTSLGGSAFLLFVFGAYTALRPVEKDILNPINRAIPLKRDTRIAILMPIYEEDPSRVGGGLMAMMEELSEHEEATHFDWFILSDSRDVDIVLQEKLLLFTLREKFPNFNIAYRHRISNTFSKVGNISDFYRRWGRNYKYVVMLDADSILPGESCILLARAMEGNNNTALIQSRFMEITSSTLFGMVSNFRFMFDNYLYTYYYNYFNPGRGFYMGHNAIVRVEAFMECCNLPIAERSGPFAAGKMISHDYYEGSLLLGGGYDTWILPQIISFDEQLHNILTFFARERRWLVGAQTWFRFFMSKSLSNFGKINMFQRALFYYAAVVGLCTFILSFYGLHYVFMHPIKTRMAMLYFKRYQAIGYTKYLFMFAMFLLVPASMQITVYYITFVKKKLIKKMGGHVKYLFSYFIFSFVQSNIILIAMCLINKFLFDWLKQKELHWGAQDRDGTLLSWDVCIKSLYPISILGCLLMTYSVTSIFPYINDRTLAILHIPHSRFGMFFFKFGIIFAPLVLALAPAIARLTSRELLLFKKKKWLQTPYDAENLYPVVKKTYAYTKELRSTGLNSFTFEKAISDVAFTLRHMGSVPERPQKYSFWKDKLKKKDVSSYSNLEKFLILRCRELWEDTFLKKCRK